MTKADAVDEETLALAVAEAHELVPEAEVVAVSAKTGAGLDELRAALGRAAVHERDARRADAPLRRPRVHAAGNRHGRRPGRSGRARSAAGDLLRVEPAGNDVRIRSVQVHDAPVERADAGQRVAVNLPAIDRSALARGDVLVTPDHFPVSYRLDVALHELDAAFPRR